MTFTSYTPTACGSEYRLFGHQGSSSSLFFPPFLSSHVIMVIITASRSYRRLQPRSSR
ncbi:hypothetical protein GBA52_020925 [Prunus armeniaca]|nr:hypothetical protein GBA52_020925 [Prunus armeniaca]